MSQSPPPSSSATVTVVIADDEPLARKTLQRLADRRAADPELLAERALGDDGARRQLERDDALLELAIGALGQALRRLDRLAPALSDRGFSRHGCHAIDISDL